MEKLSIAITTFRQRKDLVKDLVNKIRQQVPETVDIIITVNGNYGEDMPDDYRQEMLDLAKSYKNIYLIMCPEFKSLSKLFNTISIFSKTEYTLILNDDAEYLNPQAYSDIMKFINETNCQFFTLGTSFSHFVCSKNILHQLGYFDERLLAFGNEDGDMHYRYLKMFGTRIPMLYVPGIYNKAAFHLSSENLDTFTDNKPTVVQKIFDELYKLDDEDGITTPMCPTKIKKIVPDIPQYPHEEFVRKNKHNIQKFDKIVWE